MRVSSGQCDVVAGFNVGLDEGHAPFAIHRIALLIRKQLHISLRYSCTNRTAMAPSPTADATRLMESDRTSPAAKTPARLVSRRNGCRRPVQWGESAKVAPVLMNPWASRSISEGSQSVRGT